MEQYSELSRIYDYLVAGVDFDAWIDYAEALLQHFGLQARSVADIACGTGNTAIPFARRGYKTFGIDISGEMLALARAKSAADNLSVTFLKQDMRHLRLPEKVDLITCFHDGLNYLLEIEDIKQTFHKVNENLLEHGAFIFDLNAITWLSGADNSVTVMDDADMTIIWESGYNKTANIWHINLTGFVREGEYYKKFSESHREKAYRPEEIASCLGDTGFMLLGSFDAFTFDAIHSKSIRHFYVAQKMITE